MGLKTFSNIGVEDGFEVDREKRELQTIWGTYIEIENEGAEDYTENQADQKQGERNINNDMVEKGAFNEGPIVQDVHTFEGEYSEDEYTILQEVSKQNKLVIDQIEVVIDYYSSKTYTEEGSKNVEDKENGVQNENNRVENEIIIPDEIVTPVENTQQITENKIIQINDEPKEKCSGVSRNDMKNMADDRSSFERNSNDNFKVNDKKNKMFKNQDESKKEHTKGDVSKYFQHDARSGRSSLNLVNNPLRNRSRSVSCKRSLPDSLTGDMSPKTRQKTEC